MKNKMRTLFIASILAVLCALPAKAGVGSDLTPSPFVAVPPIPSGPPAPVVDTSSNPITSIYNDASSWLTTPDTNNLTLANTYNRVETGPILQRGLTIADEVFIEHHFKSNKLALISQTENASIAGTIAYQGAGLGYVIYQKFDTEIVPYVAGGYRFDQHKIQGGCGGKVRHMLNKRMYVAPSVEVDFGKKVSPKVGAEAGWAI
jgi:hypothetical protein